MLETAVIFTSFFALLVGIIDVGQVLFVHQTVSERARAAARWGASRPLDTSTRVGMENIVLYNSSEAPKDGAGSFGMTRSNVLIDQIPASGALPPRVTVHVHNYGFQFLAPYLAGRWTGRDISVSMSSEVAN